MPSWVVVSLSSFLGPECSESEGSSWIMRFWGFGRNANGSIKIKMLALCLGRKNLYLHTVNDAGSVFRLFSHFNEFVNLVS